MFNIIQNTVGESVIQTVSARDLHTQLGVGKDFTTWIKGRIEKYGFEEGKDYAVSQDFDSPIRGNQTNSRGGDRKSVAYHISLDMAKELAMVENNEQGRKARRYFIECEKNFKNTPVQQAPIMLSQVENDMRCIELMASSLRVSESSKVGMFTKYCKQYAPQLTNLLPNYAVDAPIIAGETFAGSSLPTAPISEIVEGVTTAVKANKALYAAGLLERKERRSGLGGADTKSYWSITEDGLEYGKNITSPANPRETQPHWYVSKTDELISIIEDNM